MVRFPRMRGRRGAPTWRQRPAKHARPLARGARRALVIRAALPARARYPSPRNVAMPEDARAAGTQSREHLAPPQCHTLHLLHLVREGGDSTSLR